MPVTHKVRQGESCAHIAAEYGVPEEVVWNDGGNASLKKLRKNPNVLYPGDVVTIPDSHPEGCQGGTEERHRFRRLGVPLKLRLELRDSSGEPLASHDCELTLGAEPISLTSDDSGRLEVELPIDVEEAELQLDGRKIALSIAHLDPVTELSGWRERLNNLGYGAGTGDDENDEQLRYALEEFQCDHGLAVDGICGPKSQAKLVEVHGC